MQAVPATAGCEQHRALGSCLESMHGSEMVRWLKLRGGHFDSLNDISQDSTPYLPVEAHERAVYGRKLTAMCLSILNESRWRKML